MCIRDRCKDLVYKTDMRANEDKVIISLRSKVSVNLRDRDMFFLRRSQWQRKHIRKRDAELDILHDIPTMLKRVILSVENKPLTWHEQKDDADRVLHYTCTPSEMLSHPGMAYVCLLYTSDAADERSSVDLGGRRIIKKKKKIKKNK